MLKIDKQCFLKTTNMKMQNWRGVILFLSFTCNPVVSLSCLFEFRTIPSNMSNIPTDKASLFSHLSVFLLYFLFILSLILLFLQPKREKVLNNTLK